MYSLSQPIFSALLLLSSTLLVVVDAAPFKQHVYETTKHYGGWGGNAFSFMCTPGSFMMNITGTYQDTYMAGVTFTCSDGAVTGSYGTDTYSTSFAISSSSGFSTLTIAYDSQIAYLGTAAQSVGYGGGVVVESYYSNAGCNVVGVNGLSSNFLNGISFVFQCPDSTSVTTGASLEKVEILGQLSAGNVFQFDCPPGSFINQISGKSADVLYSIAVSCSGSIYSNVFGNSQNQGNQFNLPLTSTPITTILMSTGFVVDALGYNSQLTGGGSDKTFSFQDGNGCGATGIVGRADDRLYALGFKFTCTGDQKSAETSLTQQLVGGFGGAPGLFSCPAPAFMTQMVVNTDGSVLNQVSFVCSDGSVSQNFGQGGASDVVMPSMPKGITIISVAAWDEILNIDYGSKSANAVPLGSVMSDPEGCPAVGAMVRSGAHVNALSFSFRC